MTDQYLDEISVRLDDVLNTSMGNTDKIRWQHKRLKGYVQLVSSIQYYCNDLERNNWEPRSSIIISMVDPHTAINSTKRFSH